MFSEIHDKLLRKIYGIDPVLIRKIHEIITLLEPIYGAATQDTVQQCLAQLIRQYNATHPYCDTEQYIYQHAIQLIAEDFHYRVALAIKNNATDTIADFVAGKISLSDLGKATDIAKHAKKSYTCISCGDDAIYDAANKKFNCHKCYASYADLEY